MPSSGCILIVDDDRSVRDMLAEYLGMHGFDVAHAVDGQSMRAEIERSTPDVVLLDIKLPGEDGLSLARYLRERYDLGIIMVTGSSEVVDRIVGLEMGADDYVTKPFDPRELLARVKNVLRRLQAKPAPSVASSTTAQRVNVGRCMLDLVTHQLYDGAGCEVPMTSMEFDLLKVFVEHSGKVLSRDQLLTLTKNREWEPYDRSIDIRIARLRRKVEADPENPAAIRTVRGAGYMFISARSP